MGWEDGHPLLSFFGDSILSYWRAINPINFETPVVCDLRVISSHSTNMICYKPCLHNLLCPRDIYGVQENE